MTKKRKTDGDDGIGCKSAPTKLKPTPPAYPPPVKAMPTNLDPFSRIVPPPPPVRVDTPRLCQTQWDKCTDKFCSRFNLKGRFCLDHQHHYCRECHQQWKQCGYKGESKEWGQWGEDPARKKGPP